MSGYQAFVSFANFLRDQLVADSAGITVVLEKHEERTPPYLFLQDGPDHIQGGWSSNRMCQGWLVVGKESTKPLSVSAGEYMDKVLKACRTAGYVVKYDYTTTPETIKGYFLPKIVYGRPQPTGLITGISAELSTDPFRSKKVVTFELYGKAVSD